MHGTLCGVTSQPGSIFDSPLPRGHLIMSGNILDIVRWLGGISIASSRWKPEVPTILQRTGQASTTKKYQVQNVSSVKSENPDLEQAMNSLASCNLSPVQQTASLPLPRGSFQNSLSLIHFYGKALPFFAPPNTGGQAAPTLPTGSLCSAISSNSRQPFPFQFY